MTLSAGTNLGPYQVLAQIGAGGMGEVYRARDTRLKRDIAIKILPDAWARDTDRRERFRREAELLATLNHPNIAAIYGVEESPEIEALLLELVDGPTLADRLASGSLPVSDALAIARQIVDALEAAHEHGIVHRDLKPANIKLKGATADIAGCTVKILDFGIAKALASDDASALVDAANSPTITSPARDAGGHHPRHRRLHVAGTGARPGRGQTIRHLGFRLRALRNAVRPQGIFRAHRHGHARRYPGASARLDRPARNNAATCRSTASTVFGEGRPSPSA